MSSCTHMIDGDCTHALALPIYGARPSEGVCSQCEHYAGAPRGIGDIVHTLATVTGLAAIQRVVHGKCGKCAKRRIEMNTRYPS
jgi:hypothetical protein